MLSVQQSSKLGSLWVCGEQRSEVQAACAIVQHTAGTPKQHGDSAHMFSNQNLCLLPLPLPMVVCTLAGTSTTA
jgi:hypothetical protein